MSGIKNTQRILEAIDQLRRRKARPDRKRICNYVCRRHLVTPLEIFNDLERLVDEQTVIKVEYKGNISYRNAAKWAKLSVHKSRVEVQLNEMNKLERLKTETERMTYALRGAVSALIVKEPTMRLALSTPASPADSDEGPNATKDLRTSPKQDEMDSTTEVFTDSNMCTSPTQSWPDEGFKPGFDGDPYADADGVELDVNSPSAPSSPVPNPDGSSPAHDQPDPVHDEEQDNEPETTDLARTTQQSAADAANVDAVEAAEGGGYRAGERRKRAKKKVFDPSDNNIPKVKKRGRPPGTFKQGSTNHDENGNKEKSDAPPPILGFVCALCNAEIKDTKIISCRDCTKKAHSICLQKSLKNATKARSGPWQCTLCKTCQICSQTKELGNMAVCCLCDEAYHVKCLSPRPKIPLKKWVCQCCNPPETKSAACTPDGSPSKNRGPPVLLPTLPTLPTALSPVASDIYADLNDCSIDESIPDASEWTAEEVFQYFKKLFPDHANVFKDQDIDGRSLLLMTRNDVINGLSLKLGPSLKIYGQVKRLQLRRSERHLLWE